MCLMFLKENVIPIPTSAPVRDLPHQYSCNLILLFSTTNEGPLQQPHRFQIMYFSDSSFTLFPDKYLYISIIQ